jgi:hypothetical protein
METSPEKTPGSWKSCLLVILPLPVGGLLWYCGISEGSEFGVGLAYAGWVLALGGPFLALLVLAVIRLAKGDRGTDRLP